MDKSVCDYLWFRPLIPLLKKCSVEIKQSPKGSKNLCSEGFLVMEGDAFALVHQKHLLLMVQEIIIYTINARCVG